MPDPNFNSGFDDAALLTVAQMAQADRLAIAAGVTGVTLMAAAGKAVADRVRALALARDLVFPATVVLCGPGKNGGDGFVAARLLAAENWPVTCALLGHLEDLPADARSHAQSWVESGGAIVAIEQGQTRAALSVGVGLADADIVVDALFGAGLSRPLDGAVRDLVVEIERLRAQRGLLNVAVDIPSGIEGDSGRVSGGTRDGAGAAAAADATVTFFRLKPGHLLMPGRTYCGVLSVADIGIPDAVLAEIQPNIHANGPELWRADYPWPHLGDHKYSRGLALIVGGDKLTGAARLAGHAALRAGAGLVSIAAPATSLPIYRTGPAGITVRELDDIRTLTGYVADPRVTAVLIGPGGGVGAATREYVLAALDSAAGVVLDADALTSFEETPEHLFAAIAARPARACVLTPHEGEFVRLFGRLEGTKYARAAAAASVSGAVVLLKGPDTVIAAPSSGANAPVAINHNAPATLATAGAGDVLAGFIVALLAQGMGDFNAACAGAWLHGACAAAFGPGLIADDLPDRLPKILAQLGN